MESFDYAEAAEVAGELIQFFGKPKELVKKGIKGGYDAKGNPVADTADTSINGTITPLLPYGLGTVYETDGTAIEAGDQYCFYDTKEVIEIGMIAEINGKKWRVVSIPEQLTSLDDVRVYTKLQMRR